MAPSRRDGSRGIRRGWEGIGGRLRGQGSRTRLSQREERNRSQSIELAFLQTILPAASGLGGDTFNAIGAAIVTRHTGLDQVTLDLPSSTVGTSLRGTLLDRAFILRICGGVLSIQSHGGRWAMGDVAMWQATSIEKSGGGGHTWASMLFNRTVTR